MSDRPHETCTSFPPDSLYDLHPFPDEWRTEAVLGLAFGIRADEAFDRMPILADALEEAGCDDRLLLDHCRYCERHTPDCWALECVISNHQEFWTDAVWTAKGQPLPTPAELETEAAADTRQAKRDRLAVRAMWVCAAIVMLIVLRVILMCVFHW